MIGRRTLPLLVTLVLLVAGCTAPGASVPSLEAGEVEDPEVTIGLLPIVDVAPVYLAIERGLFADEGLRVTVEVVQGGAAAVPALVSGDLDIAYGNWVSFLLANREGLELRAVAGGVSAAPGFTELLALPGKGLDGNPEGLEGTTIAVNTLQNIGELAVRSTLADAGLEPDAATLVEIPFPEMGAALEREDVDVIWASEPIPTIVKGTLGAVVVADSFVGALAGFPVAGYQASADYAARNPATIAAFARAMAAASALIAEDPALVAELVPGYTSLDAELAADLALPGYGAAIDVATLERVHDRLSALGMIRPGLELDELVVAADGG